VRCGPDASAFVPAVPPSEEMLVWATVLRREGDRTVQDPHWPPAEVHVKPSATQEVGGAAMAAVVVVEVVVPVKNRREAWWSCNAA
jgi:hypothetical protein